MARARQMHFKLWCARPVRNTPDGAGARIYVKKSTYCGPRLTDAQQTTGETLLADAAWRPPGQTKDKAPSCGLRLGLRTAYPSSVQHSQRRTPPALKCRKPVRID